jgi:hypothetical protein
LFFGKPYQVNDCRGWGREVIGGIDDAIPTLPNGVPFKVLDQANTLRISGRFFKTISPRKSFVFHTRHTLEIMLREANSDIQHPLIVTTE